MGVTLEQLKSELRDGWAWAMHLAKAHSGHLPLGNQEAQQTQIDKADARDQGICDLGSEEAPTKSAAHTYSSILHIHDKCEEQGENLFQVCDV